MLDAIFPAFLVAAALVLASVMSSALAYRFGAPLLLVFLGVGLLAGEDGFGISYDDAESAYLIGSLALAIILFDSGFDTKLKSFRQAAAPAITLATLGVALTAGLVGVAAHYVLGLPWLEAFLLGAIVASTDAAAVFFLLRVGGITIRDHVRSTLEVESGSNDPMAIFLTLILLELILAGGNQKDLWQEIATGFAMQMGMGAITGIIGGYAIVAAANRIKLEGALYPIGVISSAICLFGLVGVMGGSGFLAVYVAGLVAGNSQITGHAGLRRFMEGLTWIAQIAMFLTLGLLATPSEFLDVAIPAIAIALGLTFICRPMAIWLCLLPFRYQRNETAFISWVGLRGAVSILLGIIPLAGGLENGQLLFNIAYIIVLTSLLLQGWTIRPMARWLGLIVPARIGPVERVGLDLPGRSHHELIVYRVVNESPVLQGERLPRWARPSLVVRDGRSMRYQYAGHLQKNDLVYMFVAPQYIRLLDRLFASPKRLSQDDAEFFGRFTLDPKKPLSLLVDAYDLQSVPERHLNNSIADFMVQRLGGTAEVGDRVACGEVDLVVRDVRADGEIAEVGLAVDQAQGQAQIPLFLSGEEIWRWVKEKTKRKLSPDR
ncbi:potassium/proton antiporter [Sinorhizobium alkalisoli]|uniref:K+/H+ antiporter n=1 Tax=Sinorhizobium alkalisoli TaxID=1752398 RepID=A0A1E3VDC5_9HYPH|nr:potassium/proton antiporter [Sinorhizobium alkalisoli]MCA1492312.1 potassium/proton antiporter [Ensifer sp. NBAIM29]MCG5479281.1 potassium/proton antiporter [Sinorhizobium alkalisoli]ODR91467.1 K+/H+ antiporter [Sinorhizobium alkalisoli]QFI66420.1 Na+/H+ antiporter [Sinorhizobium alkalisoli]